MMNYAGIYEARNEDVVIRHATSDYLWEDFKSLYEDGFWKGKSKNISFEILMRCEPGLDEIEMWNRYGDLFGRE